MNGGVREIRESPWEQGEDEARDYVLDTAPWGGAPGSPAVTLYDDGGEDVTDEHVAGGASVNGDTIVTGVVSGLQAGRSYRLEILFEHQGRTEEAWGIIECTK